MNKLPLYLQVEFFKVLNGEITVDYFEQWIYKNKELEAHFEQADYVELISLNFKDRHIIHEMKKIVGNYLEVGEFEKRKISKILNDIITKNQDFAKSLISTYDLYCNGYGFLDDIGLGYGLTFTIDFFDFRDWTNLPTSEKNKKIDAIYEDVKAKAEKVQSWFDTKKIILTGEVDDLGHYGYIDNRSDEEKKPTGYLVEQPAKKSTAYNRTLPKTELKWWQKLFGS